VGNVLKMEKQQQIRALLELGWTYREVEKATGIRRETVSKYDHRKQDSAKAAKVPTDVDSKPATCPPGIRSSAAKYDEAIRNGLTHGLSAQRIYQDLVGEGFIDVSYDAVKRYVRKLKNQHPKVYARLHSLPGEEAQVDFGQGAPTVKNGKYRKPWLFKMVLSCSRHSYEEVVWSQDVETFLRCHERAFSVFGGVPRMVRLDNLKSGVLKAHLYEPELNPVYQHFAQHYGFLPLPCLPGKPEHKGKTESGVKYTQENALKSRRFSSLEEQNAFLKYWNRTWARTRIHGTTKTQVFTMFQDEQGHLKALPDKTFDYFKIGVRTVHADGHIEVNKSYYSVPYKHLGKQVTVHFNSLWIKVFVREHQALTLIAFHRAIQPGRFRTSKEHLPEKKCFTTLSFTNYLLEKCKAIGAGCTRWAQDALREREERAFRPIQGVLALRRSYEPSLVDLACVKAATLGSFRYHTVKLLCEDSLKRDEKADDFLQQHELIRETTEYAQYLESLIP
jgi:transposase